MSRITIERPKTHQAFAVVSKSVLKDKRLSYKAKGLFAVIEGLPDNWDLSIAGLSAIAKDGRESVSAGMRELVDAGYCTRSLERDDKGMIIGIKYHFYESPSSDSPFTENPSTAYPSTDKCPQYNNYLMEELINTPPTPKGGVASKGNAIDERHDMEGQHSLAKEPIVKMARKDRESESLLTAKVPLAHRNSPPKVGETPPLMGFDEFWQAYPRKVAKEDARKAWAKIKPDLALFAAIMGGLGMAKKSKAWVKDNGDFIPHPATWLNGKRWEDVEPEPQQKPRRVAL